MVKENHMKWFLILVASLAFALAGCSKAVDGSDTGEGGDPTADTADIQGGDNPEAQPAADGQQPADQASAEAPPADGSVPADAPPPVDASSPPPADSAAPPSDVASSTPAAAGTGEMVDYTIQRGDTLMKIAFNLYGDINKWNDIYSWNKDKLSNPNVLSSGTTLKYDKPASEPVIEKNGEPYLIKTGDTLGSIADDVYAKRNKWKKIYENNRTLIKDPNKIYAGFYLYYQITEQEKQEAQQIKASRGSQPQQLGAADAGAGAAAPAAGAVQGAPLDAAAAAVPPPAMDAGAPAGAPPVDAAAAGAVDNRTPGSVQ
jgi:nucleoid-associated protein YgaU